MTSNWGKIFRFYFVRRFLSPVNMLIAFLLLVVLIGAVTGYRHLLADMRPRAVRAQLRYSGPDSWQNIPPDTAQQQVFTATSRLFWVLPETEIFSYFRHVVPLLAFLIPLLAFIFSYKNVSGDRESGRSLSLYTLPVKRRDLVIGKLLGDFASFALTNMIMFAVLLVLITQLLDLSMGKESYLRIGLYLISAWMYLLVFMFVGTLISAWSKGVDHSLLLCIIVFLAVGIASLARDGVGMAAFSEYPPLPQVSEAAAQRARSILMWGEGPPPVFVREARPQWVEEQAALDEFVVKLQDYRSAFYRFTVRRHRFERFLNFLSPANLHIEVASALLQDRFIPPYRVFAPVPLDEARATIGQSLRYLLPEILFTLAMIALLFWLNVRALVKMEV